MTIKTLAARGTTRSDIARLLGVTEGAVRHHLRRMAAGVADGRSLRPMRAESQAEAIEHWRSRQGEGAVNLAALQINGHLSGLRRSREFVAANREYFERAREAVMAKIGENAAAAEALKVTRSQYLAASSSNVPDFEEAKPGER